LKAIGAKVRLLIWIGLIDKCVKQSWKSLRSSLCTATNETSHERFFNFRRDSHLDCLFWRDSLNNCIMFFLNDTCISTTPSVDNVELVRTHHNYAVVRHPYGCKTTMSTCDWLQRELTLKTKKLPMTWLQLELALSYLRWNWNPPTVVALKL